MKKACIFLFLLFGVAFCIFAMDPEAEQKINEVPGSSVVQEEPQQIIPGAAYCHKFEDNGFELRERFSIKIPDEKIPVMIAFFNAQGDQIRSLVMSKDEAKPPIYMSMLDPQAGPPEVDSYSIEIPHVVKYTSDSYVGHKLSNFMLKRGADDGHKQIVFYKNGLPVKWLFYNERRQLIYGDSEGGGSGIHEGRTLQELTSVKISGNIERIESFYNE